MQGFSYSGCQVHSSAPPLTAEAASLIEKETLRYEGFPLKAGFSLTASQAASSSGGVAFFILLDIVDKPMNGSSYAQYTTSLIPQNRAVFIS
jgi:hypothetical protein